MHTPGEYGIVYKGFLMKHRGGGVSKLVAIKTLKGYDIVFIIKYNS